MQCGVHGFMGNEMGLVFFFLCIWGIEAKAMDEKVREKLKGCVFVSRRFGIGIEVLRWRGIENLRRLSYPGQY